ncbi:MAG: GIY-YIG nuclease family protein, partial [Patescibacteria group bacterium]|nr:GIY-YIG nuclease family protein [Patescibacteria group bacterium]
MKLINKIEKLPFEKVNFKNLDNMVGVYIFFDKNLKTLYIGKSKNLKARLTSYKSKGLFGKTKALIEQVKYFSYLPVNSEIEALLLEADLVKKISPRYNIELKDDKSPLYIRITSEKYARVLTARKSDELQQNDFFVGPFPSSETVKNMLRMIRRVFPYSQHTPTKKQCIYAQMGLCSPCPSLIENTNDVEIRKELYRKYLNNIRFIKRLLLGKLKGIYFDFDKEMRRYIDLEQFEKANEVKKRIETLNYVTQNITKPKEYIENPNFLDDVRRQEIDELLNILRQFMPCLTKVDRIECYDVAHLSGIFPTASMVTFVNGNPDKKMYRRFRIQQQKGNDDIASMNEVAHRRALHFGE